MAQTAVCDYNVLFVTFAPAMHPLVFISPVILTFIIFLIPSKIREFYAIGLTVFIAVITSIPAISGFCETLWLKTGSEGHQLTFTIDKLTAFFILITNFTAITGVIVSGGIMKPYGKSAVQNALSYFSYSWLHLSMLGLLMLRDGIPFLIAWELMAVSSFMLILYDAEKRAILKTAVNYLVQMHIGLVLLVIALLLVWKATGKMSFDALQEYFSGHSNIGLFLLFFAGFAMKAGFVPFHTWLPEAHPAAPSHVSGFMSGVMIKMGIYGIFRVIVNLQTDIYTLGIIVLVISSASALFGILLSAVQKDLKRLLAFCSIENIGIIGIGIGTGMIGWGSHNLLMMVFGFAGALLHVVNHSLVKSLLFFSTGALYMRYHTRNMEELGGVIKQMPATSGMFLIGSLGISGLPPMGTFISELLIYASLFTGLKSGLPFQSITMIFAIIALVLTGGIAIFTFSKAFGITFLGTSRKNREGIHEAGYHMIIIQALIAGLILITGLFPFIIIDPLISLIHSYFPVTSDTLAEPAMLVFSHISIIFGILIILILGLYYLRLLLNRNRSHEKAETWGCGYTEGTPKIQYTGTSFAGNLAELASPLIPSVKEFDRITRKEIFPVSRKFAIRYSDFFRRTIIRLTDGSNWILKYLARLQTGHIQHYILYAFVFILIIFSLLYLKII